MKWASIGEKYHEFFFAPQLPHSVALLRIASGLACCGVVYYLMPISQIWLGSEGPGSMTILQATLPQWKYILIQNTVGLLGPTYFLFFVLMISFTLMLGALTAPSALSAFFSFKVLGWCGLAHFIPGLDVLGFTFLALIFAKSGAVWSIDAYWRTPNADGRVLFIQPWAARLLQLNLIIGYFSAAYEKLGAPDWAYGQAFYYLSQSQFWRGPDVGSLFSTYKFLSPLMTYTVIALQLVLALFLYNSKFRYYLILCGILLHLMIEVTLYVPFFGLFMICRYALFVDPNDLVNLQNRLLMGKSNLH